MAMVSRTLLVLLAASVRAKAAAPPLPSEPVVAEPSKPSRGIALPASLGAAVLAGALPVCRQAVVAGVRKLLKADRTSDYDDYDDDYDDDQLAAGASTASAPTAPAPAGGASRGGASSNDEQGFKLTPEQLSVIATLNPRVEAIAPLLAAVPVFTVALGNGSTPLTVPSEDGSKLAYFFLEAADAQAFLRAVQQQADLGSSLGKAQVIGISMADILRAYSSETAKAARESFALIPASLEVMAARGLLKERQGEAGVPDADALGPGNGLVPVFWSEDLAVQTASGKQRKILFFSSADLAHMWKNLSDSRQEAGQLDMPTEFKMQVSDLQTVASYISDSNKTDDIMFAPSSSALRAASTSLARQDAARAAGGGGGVPMGADGKAGMDMDDGGEGEAADDGLDGMLDAMPFDDDEEEEEEE